MEIYESWTIRYQIFVEVRSYYSKWIPFEHSWMITKRINNTAVGTLNTHIGI